MVSVYHSLFTQDELDFFLHSKVVADAKERLNNGAQSVYFSLSLPADLKAKLSATFAFELPDEVPMRWIQGDTAPHIDRGSREFTDTYLAYLTNSPGELIVGDEAFPLTQGSAYCFNEGLYHETKNTGTEPRLLLGPMSEQGFAVGSVNLIQGDGGTSVFIYEDGGILYWYLSTNPSNINTVSFPCTIENTNIGAGYLTVIFQTNITLSGISDSFLVGSSNIQFGSSSLSQATRSRAQITITAANYNGLIQNGTSSSSGFNNIRICNLHIDGSTSSLAQGAGWIGQSYFGKGANGNYILNCSSSGYISIDSGGIVGSYAAQFGATLRIISCSSDGTIGNQGGGIVGPYAGDITVSISQCFTTGEISGNGAGGIVGANCINVEITKSYSTGLVSGDNAGGILGFNAGSLTASITNCYSTGAISGTSAGGICGSLAPGGGSTFTVSITNCYTTGNLSNADPKANGAICGLVLIGGGEVFLIISHCYATGTTVLPKGYIIGNDTTINGTNSAPLQYILTNNYSEAANSSSGWNSINAANTLQNGPTSEPGVGSTWSSRQANTEYELTDFGPTPYQLQTTSADALIQTYSQTIQQGQSSTQAILYDASVNAFQILAITGGDNTSYNTITISSQTGAISTTTATGVGVYTIYVRSTGSYQITTFELTVTEPGGSNTNTSGCCGYKLDLQYVDFTTRAEIISGSAILSNLGSSGNRQNLTLTDLIRIRQAKASKRA